MSKEQKEEEKYFPWGLVIIFGVIITVASLAIGAMVYYAWTSETIVVEGTIVSAEYIINDDFGMNYDFLRVTFDNNETYDLVMSEDEYDFTVSSRLILKLDGHRSSNRWSVLKVVKVPDDVSEEVD